MTLPHPTIRQAVARPLIDLGGLLDWADEQALPTRRLRMAPRAWAADDDRLHLVECHAHPGHLERLVGGPVQLDFDQIGVAWCGAGIRPLVWGSLTQVWAAGTPLCDRCLATGRSGLPALSATSELWYEAHSLAVARYVAAVHATPTPTLDELAVLRWAGERLNDQLTRLSARHAHRFVRLADVCLATHRPTGDLDGSVLVALQQVELSSLHEEDPVLAAAVFVGAPIGAHPAVALVAVDEETGDRLELRPPWQHPTRRVTVLRGAPVPERVRQVAERLLAMAAPEDPLYVPSVALEVAVVLV